MLRITRLTWVLLLLVVGTAGVTRAVEVVTVWAEPGVSEYTITGVELQVQTSAPIIVEFSIDQGDVVGAVQLAPGTTRAYVTITLVEDPERIIFQGKVSAAGWFADYLPQETGRGEQ